MKKLLLAAFSSALLFTACKKKSLEVTNLNQPSLDVLNTESGIIGYAKGFYKIGFGDQGVASLDDGLGYGMLLIVNGFHESMGDNIFIPWGNNSYKFADNPTWVKLDNGVQVNNPIGQGNPLELKLRNDRAYGASNAFLPEWTYMYFLNNTANVLLSKADGTVFAGDAATKKKVLQAWAKWWKGYAYCRIGSMYIAGVIAETPNSTNGQFVTNTAMVTEGIKNLDAAAAILGTVASGGGYDEIIKQMIPLYMQPGGKFPSPAEWIRNINSFKARSILVNKRTKDMTAADYSSLLTIINNGIQASDYVFQVRTFADNSKSIFDKDYGSDRSYTATDDPTFWPSERLLQDYKAGDKRKSNNFNLLGSAVINKRGRGITFGTRYYLKDGGNGNGAYTYFNFDYGADTYYIGASFAENQLMKAECLINGGSQATIDQGIALIDGVRTLQGANLAATPTGLTKVAALEELRKERRCALLFRGLAFYDLRRLGMTDDVSKGGGRTGCVVLDAAGAVQTNCIINYNYLPYWDVPQNEIDFNAPASGSAPVKSPL
ncbi:MAG: RagB/SusD family nutrient uptake outer membrane protein [Chitinophagaceae bacterium]